MVKGNSLGKYNGKIEYKQMITYDSSEFDERKIKGKKERTIQQLLSIRRKEIKFKNQVIESKRKYTPPRI